jgi:hypothetical protein
MVRLWDANDVSGAWLVGNLQGYQAATGTPICEVTAPPSPDGSGATTGGNLTASQSALSRPLCAPAHAHRAEEAQQSLRWRRPDQQALVRHRPMVVGSGAPASRAEGWLRTRAPSVAHG